jgi:YHS domain-containing protein
MKSNHKNNTTQVVVIKNQMGKKCQLFISVLIFLLLTSLLLSCSDKKKEVNDSTLQQNAEASIKANETMAFAQNYEIVSNEKVCMVNDRFMGIDQIPIEVSGIMYYGCCENCVEKLQKNLNDVRFGSNPLNNTKVDKASAVIVQDKSSGSVFYFASKEDANTFIRQK